MICDYIKNILSSFEKQPTNQEELEEALLLIWNTMIHQDYINNLIDTFENRFKMCCHVYGGSISHFLQAGEYSECPKEIEEFIEEENASDYVYEEEEEQPEYEYEYKEEEEEEEEDYEPSVRWIDG